MSYDRERRRLEIFRRSPDSESSISESSISDSCDSSPQHIDHAQSSPESDSKSEDLNGFSLILIPGILGFIGYCIGGGTGEVVGIIVGLGINLWRGRSVVKDLFP